MLFPKGGFLLINKVEICGVDTSKLPVLSNEEKLDLLEKIKKGDTEARTTFINGNLRLVLSVIRRFFNKGENADDLFQIGCVGLIKAIDNFEVELNVQFSTYAVPMILGEVRRYLRDNNSVRVSRSLRDIAYKALKIKEQVYNQSGEDASVEQIAEELQVKPFDVVQAIESLREPVSMFEPIYSDGGDTIYLFDQLEDKSNNSEEFSLKMALNDAIEQLEEREQYILDERFIIGKTQMEIANELQISQAQVSRIEKGAIKQLKKVLK